MTTLDAARVRAWRMRSQSLHQPERTVLDAVRRAAALQAQDTKASRQQLRARTRGMTAADLDAACAGPDPLLVRTWLMRGTLHAVPAADVRWMTDLLGPRFAAASRGRRGRLGLDDDTCATGLAVLEEALAGAPPLRRDEVVRRIAALGLPLDPASQAPAHLMAYAAQLGLVCRGPEAPGDKATYVLREEWLSSVDGPRFTEEEALAELAARHAAGYGPVTEADFARWSGLPLGRARTAFRLLGDRLERVDTPAGPMWVPAGTRPPDPAVPVRLLGHFDPYLLGYHDRDLLIDPGHARRVATGGGLLMPTVLVGGHAGGVWRHELRGGRLVVTVEPFAPLPSGTEPGIAEEVADLGRFLDVDAAWRYASG